MDKKDLIGSITKKEEWSDDRLKFELMKLANETSQENIPGCLFDKLYETLPYPQSKEEALGDVAYIQYILSLLNSKPAEPAVSTLKSLLG